jgi:YD repeat-containing protein
VVYTYNANGSVATKIDAKRQLLAYTYDSSQRLSQI